MSYVTEGLLLPFFRQHPQQAVQKRRRIRMDHLPKLCRALLIIDQRIPVCISGPFIGFGGCDPVHKHFHHIFHRHLLPYDPFGQDFMVYPFQNMCRELPELDYPDGLRYIYFNTRGTKGGSPAIRELLDYLQKSTKENAKNETLLTLHHHIEKVKGYQEVKDRFMTVGDVIEHVKDDTRKEDIFELLKDYGKIPDKIRERIENEFNPDILKRWHKLAARCGSMEAFEEQM